jgi:hypothetical protein
MNRSEDRVLVQKDARGVVTLTLNLRRARIWLGSTR